MVICLSVALNSIKVPPLKSTPKFNPLKINRATEKIIHRKQRMLKTLKYLLKVNL